MANTMKADSGYAPVKGGALYYEVAGQGPAVLLIHAGVADHRMWDAQFELFAGQFRVIRYDQRGYGRSRTEQGRFSSRQDVIDLLEHLGVAAAAVVGISRGGALAVDFAVEQPERVTALVPVAAGLSGFEPPPGEEDADLTRAFEAMDAAWEAGDMARLTELEVAMWADGPGQPEGRAPAAVREKVRQMCLANYARPDPEPEEVKLDPPAAGRLGEIRVPALIIHGDLDTPHTALMAEAMERGIPNARRVLFRGVAHMVPMEAPQEFNRIVLDFLAAALA
jgi:3-oxoadipate enol-lactonase